MTFLDMEFLARERHNALQREAEQNRLRRLVAGRPQTTNRPQPRLPLPNLLRR
jgi:hypothetical protein